MLPQARFSDKPALLRSISNYPNTLKTTYTLNTLTTPVQVSGNHPGKHSIMAAYLHGQA